MGTKYLAVAVTYRPTCTCHVYMT